MDLFYNKTILSIDPFFAHLSTLRILWQCIAMVDLLYFRETNVFKTSLFCPCLMSFSSGVEEGGGGEFEGNVKCGQEHSSKNDDVMYDQPLSPAVVSVSTPVRCAETDSKSIKSGHPPYHRLASKASAFKFRVRLCTFVPAPSHLNSSSPALL